MHPDVYKACGDGLNLGSKPQVPDRLYSRFVPRKKSVGYEEQADFTERKMNPDEIATATLIIAETQDIIKEYGKASKKELIERIDGLLESWVETNHLPVDKVVKIPFGSKSMLFAIEPLTPPVALLNELVKSKPKRKKA